MNSLMKMRMVSGGGEQNRQGGGGMRSEYGGQGGPQNEYRGGSQNEYNGGYGGGLRNEYRAEGGRGMRNEYGGAQNEYRAGYSEDMESRFRDGQGRQRYNNGRFAPMRSEYAGGYESRQGGRNGESNGGSTQSRMGGYESRNAPMRNAYEEDMDQGEMWPMDHYGGEYDDGNTRIIGFAAAAHKGGMRKAVPPIDHETAERWMQSLKNEDGTTGPHWTLEQVKQLMQQRGITGVDPIRVWVAMNAEYSDHVTVNRKYNMDRPEYYLDTALTTWLNDRDAIPNKEAAYYEYIVKK